MFSLFGRNDPTRSWRRSPDLRLDFDLASETLNGVPLAAALDSVSFLGPVEDRKALSQGEYSYSSLGLCLVNLQAESTIDQIEVFQNDDSHRGCSFPGTFRYEDRILDLECLDVVSFVRMFGSPYWCDDSDDEILLFYEFRESEWQVEFELNRSFNRISVTSLPIMAKADQRDAYGVTKPWPPAFDDDM